MENMESKLDASEDPFLQIGVILPEYLEDYDGAVDTVTHSSCFTEHDKSFSNQC
jgi:hypothetical protein